VYNKPPSYKQYRTCRRDTSLSREQHARLRRWACNRFVTDSTFRLRWLNIQRDRCIYELAWRAVGETPNPISRFTEVSTWSVTRLYRSIFRIQIAIGTYDRETEGSRFRR
jgi:hypothetical protein